MKIKISYILLLSALFAVSCAKVDTGRNGDMEIGYEAVVGAMSSKAIIEGNTYGEDAPSFGSAAFFLLDGKTWANDKATATEFLDMREVKYVGPYWGTTPPSYWPISGTLTFFSFSPWAIKDAVTIDNTNGVRITDWDVRGNNQELDIMVASLAPDKNTNNVETVFHHKLALIDGFSFKHDGQQYIQNEGQITAGDVAFIVNKVAIHDVFVNGTYVSGPTIANSGTDYGVWQAASTPTVDDFVLFEGSREISGVETNVAPSQTLMIPQTFGETSTSYVEIAYTVRYFNETGNSNNVTDAEFSKSVSLHELLSKSDYRWDMNKKYSYVATLKSAGVSLEVNVLPWDNIQPNWEFDFNYPDYTDLYPTTMRDVVDSEGKPVYDENGKQKQEYNYPAEGPTVYRSSDCSGDFKARFRVWAPDGCKWSPILDVRNVTYTNENGEQVTTDAYTSNYEVEVYHYGDLDGDGDYELSAPLGEPPYTNSSYEYEIHVKAKENKVNAIVKLGVSFIPAWDEDSHILLMINGVTNHLAWPNSGDGTHAEWIEIKQVAVPSNTGSYSNNSGTDSSTQTQNQE